MGSKKFRVGIAVYIVLRVEWCVSPYAINNPATCNIRSWRLKRLKCDDKDS